MARRSGGSTERARMKTGAKEEHLGRHIERQMGCMTGFFQIFDRHQIYAAKRLASFPSPVCFFVFWPILLTCFSDRLFGFSGGELFFGVWEVGFVDFVLQGSSCQNFAGDSSAPFFASSVIRREGRPVILEIQRRSALIPRQPCGLEEQDPISERRW